MYGGQIMESGPAPSILAPPHHPYTAALLSAVPSLLHTTARLPLTGEPGATPPGPGCRFAPRCPRNLGPLCDTPPPLQSFGSHTIRCHIPAAQLAATS